MKIPHRARRYLNSNIKFLNYAQQFWARFGAPLTPSMITAADMGALVGAGAAHGFTFFPLLAPISRTDGLYGPARRA